MLPLFLKGLLIGFAIAVPAGPIGILCIQRTLHNGFKVGLMTDIGAALADGTLGLIAGLGLTAVSSLLIAQQFWIRVIGGLFLIYLGIKLILNPMPEKLIKNKSDKSPLHACSTSFLLTLANPATILSFIAVFAALGVGTNNPDVSYAIILVLGITLGSAAWWLLLSSIVAFILHKRINATSMRIMNWVSGGTILVFGILALKVLIQT